MGTFMKVLGCAGCTVGAIKLAALGPAAWFVAAATPGSTMAVAACTAACVSLFVE